MYREGPLRLAEIAQRAQTDEALIEAPVERLVEAGRIRKAGEGRAAVYEARALLIPLGSSMGWEAAVFDHFKAVTRTVLVRLQNKGVPTLEDDIGGSTYTIDIWPGHPLSDEVRGTLKQVRATLSGLRERVTTYNESQSRPEAYERVVIYAGQSVVSE